MVLEASPRYPSRYIEQITWKDFNQFKVGFLGWYHVISYLCLPRLAPPSPASSLCGFIFCNRLREGEGPIYPCRLRLGILHGRLRTFKSSYKAQERFSKDNQPEDIQDCCNGILLVVHHDKNGGDGVHYSLYNPTTFERIRVPPPPHDYHTHIHYNTTMCCFASLAFDPTKSLNYKIISTPGGTITNPLKVETFSSETGKWSRYVVNIDSKLHGVEWIHCSAYSDGRHYRLLNTNYIVCVHEGKSSELLSVQAIGLPYFGGDNIYIDGDNCYASIGISNRCLHYSTRDRNGSTLLVYMLKDDVSWLLKYTIPIDDLLANRSHLIFRGLERIVNMYRKESWFNFYAFHPNCDDLFLITPCYMLFYSPKEKLLELFHSEGGIREIVVGQNYSFLYSYCPVRLQSGFQRTLGANLDKHESVATDASCSSDDY